MSGNFMSGRTKIIIIVIAFLFIFYVFQNRYNRDYFEVSIGNTAINYYIKEEYNKSWVPFIIFTKNWKQNWNANTGDSINNVKLSNSILLNITEYGCYNNYNGNRMSCELLYTEKGTPPDKSKISNNINRMMIERNNKVIYDGPYVKDITKYITEQGRYYFKLYAHRDEGASTKIDTKLIFNIKFVGVENE